MVSQESPSYGVDFVGSVPTVAHVDADSFFASVLLRKHPGLKGKPLFAVGMGGGCIIAATYEAKAKGVKTGMRLTEARTLCPGAIEMPSDFRETGIASEQIESILKDRCVIIEQTSIDEWYLDLRSIVGGIPKNEEQWAREVQREVLQKTDISVSIGVASSKLLAKMAGEYRKPAGLTVIQKKDIEEFLRDRPAAAIPGIGHRRQLQGDLLGWVTAWDIASADDDLLRKVCGRPGVEMKRELLGERLFKVSEDTRPPKSVSRCRTFKGTTDHSLLKAHLLKHLEYCTMKMRRWDLGCTEISVWLRSPDYVFDGTHKRLPGLSITVSQMLPSAILGFESLLRKGKRFNQVGLALYGLKSSGIQQQSLFEDSRKVKADERLQETMDSLHERFGRNSITRAAALPVRSGTVKELDLPMV